MTILSLAIDASQAKRGAQEAATALDQVGKAAENTGRAVDTAAKQVGTSMDAQAAKTKNFAKTVEAVGEVTQISQRVRLLGEEVRNLGSGMGSAASIGQTLSGALIDIAQISGKVEGGFAGFIGLLRANPLLVAATVIGGIATAMSLFGDETKTANEDLKRQIELQDQLRKTSVDLATQLQRNADLARVGFGIDQQEQQYLRARRIAEVASNLSGQQGFQTFADLQALTGLDEQQLRNLSPRGGIATRLVSTGGIREGTGVDPTLYRREDIGLTNEAARRVLLLLAENIKANADILQPGVQGATGPLTQAELQAVRGQQFGPPLPPDGLPGPYTGTALPTVLPRTQIAPGRDASGVGPNFVVTAAVIQQAEKRVQEFNERMRELKSLGQDVGTAIGGAFFQIVNGAANARQALAGLLQQFVAIAQQRAIQGIANSIGNAFAASTPQAAGNTPGAGSTGVSLRANPPAG